MLRLLFVILHAVYLRCVGGEVGATSSLAPKIGPLGLVSFMEIPIFLDVIITRYLDSTFIAIFCYFNSELVEKDVQIKIY